MNTPTVPEWPQEYIEQLCSHADALFEFDQDALHDDVEPGETPSEVLPPLIGNLSLDKTVFVSHDAAHCSRRTLPP